MQILIQADDFLHNMARLMIGTLLDIGFGLRKKEDIEAIFKILEKYGDDNDSIRGDLKVIDQEENTEDIDSDFEHTSKEMADKLMEFNRDFSDDSETIAEEAEYLIGVFDKLKKSEDFNILAHHLDTMFMDGVFK